MADFSKRGVFLCKCHGKMSEALPVDEICRFLEQRQPGLKVIVTDNLCQPEVLAKVVEENNFQPAVIGACSQLKLNLPFWEEPEKATVTPYSTRIVDLIGEASQDNSSDLLNRAKLMMWAQVARQEDSCIPPANSFKVQFTKSQGKTSRRDLFKKLIPQYQIIPNIKIDKCAGMEKCSICREACPFNAIVIEGQLSIDKTRCRGCGICTAICPHQAIHYPTFSFDQMDRELEGLLLTDDDALEPRIIVVSCQSCPSSSDDAKLAPNIFKIEVPCLDMASPWLVLRAFDLGAQGVAFISNKEGCKFGLDCSQWHGKTEFVRQLLEQWGIEPERLKTFEVDESEQQLKQFTQDIAQLPALPRSAQPTTAPANALPLPSLISDLREKLAPVSGGAVSAGNVPFGKLELDSSECTACGLCVLHCPTKALSSVSNGSSYQLFFHHQACVGCGQCVNICPEECLHLENILELDRLNSPAEAIFESGIIRCRECGESMAPIAMTSKIRDQFSKTEGLISQLDICPSCKIKAIHGISASTVGV